jgi:hypothetical protein
MKYNTLKICALTLFVLTMTGCQEKFNGKSEKDFKISKEKIEKKLNADEKIKLEKAVRVIALKAMVLKWDESKKYRDKSFNDIALELIDGQTYSSISDLAEDFLQERNTKEIEKLSTEIQKLEKKKKVILSIQKQLNLFKIGYLGINLKDWFGILKPTLEINYKYLGKQNLIGTVEITYDLRRKSTNEVIALSTMGYGDNEAILKHGESFDEYITLSNEVETNQSNWDTLHYPIENPNLSSLDLELKIYASSLFLNGEKIALPKIKIKDLDTEIKERNIELKQVLNSKGTLDELELTDK